MTESNRPPGFRKPVGALPRLFLYFGYDDYVVASSALSAAALWNNYFDAEGARPEDFDSLLDDDLVEILFAGDYAVAPQEVIERGGAELKRLTARALCDLMGEGYLASTTEDD